MDYNMKKQQKLLFAIGFTSVFSSTATAEKPEFSAISIGRTFNMNPHQQFENSMGWKIRGESTAERSSFIGIGGYSWYKSQALSENNLHQSIDNFTWDQDIKLERPILNSFVSVYGETGFSMYFSKYTPKDTQQTKRFIGFGYNYGGGISIKPDNLIIDIGYRKKQVFGQKHDFLNHHEFWATIGIALDT